MIWLLFNTYFICVLVLICQADNKYSEYVKRKLLQDYQDEFRISTAGCNPRLTNCTDMSAGDCNDIAPQNAIADCNTYFELGLCNVIKEEYCKFSCGRCEECKDKLFPGTNDCTIMFELGNCNKKIIKGKFCNKSCGFCQTKTSSTQPSPLLPASPPVSPFLPKTPAPVPPTTPAPTLATAQKPTIARDPARSAVPPPPPILLKTLPVPAGVTPIAPPPPIPFKTLPVLARVTPIPAPPPILLKTLPVPAGVIPIPPPPPILFKTLPVLAGVTPIPPPPPIPLKTLPVLAGLTPISSPSIKLSAGVATQGEMCACEDTSPNEEFDCTQQASFGQCDADFMKGYCQCTCGTCPLTAPFSEDDNLNGKN